MEKVTQDLTDRAFLLAQIAEIDWFLAHAPANDCLGRLGFESRRQELFEKLKVMEPVA